MRSALRFAPLCILVFACGSRSTLVDGFDETETDAGTSPSDAGKGPTTVVGDAGVVTNDAGVAPADAGLIVTVGPLRQIAPLSTSTVTSHRPVFSWTFGSTDVDGAHVEICADRACTRVLTSFEASGSYGSPSTALARGTYFWRVRGMHEGVVGNEVSPTWEFFVGARSAPVKTSWGSVLDFNGDGLADVALGTPDVTGLPYGAQLVGAVQVHLGNAGGVDPTRTTLLSPTDNGPFSELGWSLSSAGDVNGDGYGDLIAGAPGGGASPGAAYIFLGGPNGPSTSPVSPTLTITIAHDYLGWCVAGAGDIDGDGYADVVVNGEGGGTSPGGVYVAFGNADGVGEPQSLSTPSRPTGVAGAGDTNGDGYADVLVAAYEANRANGAAYLYLGGPNGLTSPPIEIDSPAPSYGFFSFWISGAGDVNGDGLADVLVGSPGVTPYAYLYYGATSGLDPKPLALASQGGPTDNLSFPYDPEFGADVSGAGDVNGDGFADVAVGTPGTATVSLYLGGSGGLSTTPVNFGDGAFGGDEFGNRISGAGDVNGDGYGDLLVAASGWGAIDSAGAAFLFLGSANGLVTSTPQALHDPGAVWGVSLGN